MAEFASFSVKLDTEKDADLIAWLSTVDNRSHQIKLALYAYRNLPAPVQPSADTPAPAASPIDLDTLKEIIDYAVDRGAEKIGQQVADKLAAQLAEVQPIMPLPGKKKKNGTAKPEIDGARLLEEMTDGLDNWGN